MITPHSKFTLMEFVSLPFDTPVTTTHGYILFMMVVMFVGGCLWGWILRRGLQDDHG